MRSSEPEDGLTPAGPGEIIEGLSELVEHLEGGGRVEEKFTARTVDLDLRPRDYAPADVRAFRTRLGISQAIFARYLGVSPKTVQAWEQGDRPLSAMARRFLDDMQADPEKVLNRLRSALVSR